MNHTITVRMLGTFSIERDGLSIHDGDNRSRKLWILLSYLLYNHNTQIPQEKLISLIWDNDPETGNTGNALKTLFHRTRALLDKLGDNVGHNLIVCKKGAYFFNPVIPYQLDVEEFEKAVNLARSTEDKQIKFQHLYRAFSLYQGDFLSKFSSESWVIPIATYYHNMYMDVAMQLIQICEEKKDYQCVIDICLEAIRIERYEENFYKHLMQNLIHAQRQEEAINVYRDLCEMLSSTFGVKPSNEIKQLFREAQSLQEKYYLEIGEVQQNLNESANIKPGALFCDYEFFSEIYHALSRSIERNGNVVHLAIITITDLQDAPLNRRSLKVCVDNLKTLICAMLRQGDVLSMCSPSQFVLMLPNANRENSEIVLNRLIKAFFRQYPHSPAKLSYVIQPVLPLQFKRKVEEEMDE